MVTHRLASASDSVSEITPHTYMKIGLESQTGSLLGFFIAGQLKAWTVLKAATDGALAGAAAMCRTVNLKGQRVRSSEHHCM
jgi:hypothetical protein